MKRTICIATRQSPLALIQAEYVKKALLSYHPHLNIEFLKLTTEGDKFLKAPLAKVGGKGLFVKELEKALLNKTADIAVHSMKDLPIAFPEGLRLAIICKRLSAQDVFVSSSYQHLADLPAGSRLGTSSLRRQSQIKHARPDLDLINLRGNVQTRLKKLDTHAFDGLILAAAGLARLKLEARICEYLPIDTCVPAVGQGVLGIECRSDDDELLNLLMPLDDRSTRQCVLAERALNAHLKGGCQVPIGAYAEKIGTEKIKLRGFVGHPKGNPILYGTREGSTYAPEKIGNELAKDLLARGADKILHDVYRTYGIDEST